MIYTVFFTGKDSNEMPQDFETYKEAVQYAEEKGEEYVIASNDGEVV